MTALRLPYDEARCVGRGGDGNDYAVCERRQACARHRAWIEHPPGHPIPLRVPVHARLCISGEDHFIPLDDHA